MVRSESGWDWETSEDEDGYDDFHWDEHSEPDLGPSGSEWSLDDGGRDSAGYSTSDEDDSESKNGAVGEAFSSSHHQWLTEVAELPHELLALVFVHANQSYHDPFALSLSFSQVSKFWRFVAQSTPRLWTVIDIRKDTGWTEVCLERSSNAKLDVHLSLHPTVDKAEGEARIIHFSSLLVPHVGRIRNITFHAYHGVWIPASFPLLGDLSRPIDVDSLDLRLLPYSLKDITADINLYDVCRQLTCRPKYLQIEQFPSSSPAFFTTSLRSLAIGWQPEGIWIDMRGLVLQLAHCPNLEYLQLAHSTGYVPHHANEPSSCAELSHLREISLLDIDVYSIDAFFRNVQTPDLRSVSIEVIDGLGNLDSLAYMAEKNPTIEQFHLTGCKINRKPQLVNFQRMLQNLPLLTDLRFTYSHIPWQCVQGLAHQSKKKTRIPLICPNLSSLAIDFDSSITHDLLISIVLSRLHRGSKVKPITSLSCRAPETPTFKPLVILQKLQDKVPELVLEDFKREPRTCMQTDSDVEEEWIGDNETLDLDSGDEEVIALGTRWMYSDA